MAADAPQTKHYRPKSALFCRTSEATKARIAHACMKLTVDGFPSKRRKAAPMKPQNKTRPWPYNENQPRHSAGGAAFPSEARWPAAETMAAHVPQENQTLPAHASASFSLVSMTKLRKQALQAPACS
jgi:hypothetical protein